MSRLATGHAGEATVASAEVESSLLNGLALDDLALLLATRHTREAAVRLRIGPTLDLGAGLGAKGASFGECLSVGRSLREGFGDSLSESIGGAAGLHAGVGRKQAVTSLNRVVGIGLRIGGGESLSGGESSALETVARSARHATRAGIKLVDIGMSLSEGLGLTLSNVAGLADEKASWVGLGDGLSLLATGHARESAVWLRVGAASARHAWETTVRVGLTRLVLPARHAWKAALWVGISSPLLAAWHSRETTVRICLGDGGTVRGGSEYGGGENRGRLHDV
jgi:hypothetical protein